MFTRNTTAAAGADHPQDKSVELNGSGAQLVHALREVKKLEAHYKDVRTTIEGMLKAAMGDAEVALVDGEPVLTYRTTLRTSVTQKLLKERYPIAAIMCSETKPVRTFVVLDK
jgi:predicted phage-related endonuclease